MDDPRERRLAVILARGLLRVQQRDERLGVRMNSCDTLRTVAEAATDAQPPTHNPVNETRAHLGPADPARIAESSATSRL